MTAAAGILSDWGVVGLLIAFLLASASTGILYIVACFAWDRRDKQRGIPITVSTVKHSSFHNYAGFSAAKEEDDAQLFSFGEVTIVNTSPTNKIVLDLFLHITGHRTGITIRADLRDAWGRIFGIDDVVSRSPHIRPRKIFCCPVELGPLQVERAELAFVVTYPRDRILNIVMKQSDYKFELEIIDLTSASKRNVRFTIPGSYP